MNSSLNSSESNSASNPQQTNDQAIEAQNLSADDNSLNWQRLQPIPHESTKQTGLTHEDGTISFARFEPGSARTEFFICLDAQPGFDYGGKNNPDLQGYAAFGKVVAGMDIVKTIYNRPEYDQALDPPVFIYNIIRK